MRAFPATPAEEEKWDDLVASLPRPHVLQSKEWATVKEGGGWRTRRFVLRDDAGALEGIAQVLVREIAAGLRYAYAPRGPLLTRDERVGEAARALAGALRGSGALALLVDPELPVSHAAALARAGCRPAGPVQPRRTLVVDLAPEAQELLGAMRRKTRQYIRKAERDGVATAESEDIGTFYDIERVVSERNRFAIHDRAYFESVWRTFAPAGRAHLFFASVERRPVATLLVLHWGAYAWEMFGGWNGEFPEMRPFYLLKWRAMLRLRQLGVRSYDMWGLADSSRPDDPLAGVESFKLGFGGEEREYVGSWEIAVQPLLFPLWRAAARVRRAALA